PSFYTLSLHDALPIYVLLRSGPVERSDHFRKLGRLLRDLHSTRPPKAFRTQPSWIDRKLAEARENLAWCDGSADLLAQLETRRRSEEHTSELQSLAYL